MSESRESRAGRTAAVPESTPGSGAAPALPPGLAAAYRVEAVLGAGAMGVVYRAVQSALDRPVALKLPTLADPEAVARFVREGRILARLSHPNLVRVYDAGEEGGRPYIALEFVRGCTVTALAGGRALPLSIAAALATQLLDGLEHAHAHHVLHRDVKGDNALVTADGVVKLADFGLARSEVDNGATRAGMIMGTPAYMSPEQALGEAVDARADIYSAAVVFFELATGRLPFVADTVGALLSMQIGQPPPPIELLVAGAPAGLGRLMSQALAKAREQRHETAGVLARELRELVGERAIEQAQEKLGALVARAGSGSEAVAGATYLGPAADEDRGAGRGDADSRVRSSSALRTRARPSRTVSRVKPGSSLAAAPAASRRASPVALPLAVGLLAALAAGGAAWLTLGRGEGPREPLTASAGGAPQPAGAAQQPGEPAGRVAGLLNGLRDARPQAREDAARALGAPGTPAAAALESLSRAALDVEARVRLAAVESLGKLGSAAGAAAGTVALAIWDADAGVRAVALSAVKRIGPAGEPVLAHRVREGEWLSSLSACRALEAIGAQSEDALSALVTGSQSSEPRMRLRAVSALGACRATTAVLDTLVRALEDPAIEIRIEAGRALGRLGRGAAQVVPRLLRAVADPKSGLRLSAAWALGQMAPNSIGLKGVNVASLSEMSSTSTGAGRAGTLIISRLGALPPFASDGQVRMLDIDQDSDPADSVLAAAALSTSREPTEKVFGYLSRAMRPRRDPWPDRMPSYAAAAALAQLGARGEAALLKGLEDPSPIVRLASAQALGRLSGAASAIAKQLARVATSDPLARVRVSAIAALGRLGPDAAPAAAELVALQNQDFSGWTNGICFAALRSTGPAAVPALQTGTRNEDANVRFRSLICLANLGAASRLPAASLLKSARSDPAFKSGFSSIAHACKLHEPWGAAAASELLAALDDASEETRRYSALALGWMVPRAVPEVLRIHRQRGDPGAQLEAARARRDAPPPELPATLVELLAYSDPVTEFMAASALARLASGPPPDLSFLEKRLGDPRVTVRNGIVLAVSWVESCAKDALLIRALADKDSGLVGRAATALGACGQIPEAAKPALGRMLGSSDKRVRQSAVLALLRFGAGAAYALQPLLALLEDPDPDLRMQVCLVLQAMGPAAAAACDPLVSILARMRHPDDPARWHDRYKPHVFIVLASIGPAATVALWQASKGPDAARAAAAREALRELGEPEAAR